MFKSAREILSQYIDLSDVGIYSIYLALSEDRYDTSYFLCETGSGWYIVCEAAPMDSNSLLQLWRNANIQLADNDATATDWLVKRDYYATFGTSIPLDSFALKGSSTKASDALVYVLQPYSYAVLSAENPTSNEKLFGPRVPARPNVAK